MGTLRPETDILGKTRDTEENCAQHGPKQN